MLPELCGLTVSIIHSKFVPPVEIAQKCIILFYKDAECQSIMKQCFMEVISYNILVFEVSVDYYNIHNVTVFTKGLSIIDASSEGRVVNERRNKKIY